MVKLTAVVEQVDAVTQEQVDRARMSCAMNALDADDLAFLLEILGIGPNWQDDWRGPVA